MDFEPGYYRLVRPNIENWESLVGELFYFTHTEGDTAWVVHGEDNWGIETEQFAESFEPAPGGAAERQQQVADLMADLSTIGREQCQLMERAAVVPSLPAPDAAPPEEPTTGTALVAARQFPAEQAARNLKRMKSSAAMVRGIIAKKQNELQSLLSEQTAIMAQQSKALAQQMEVWTEAIYMIDCYLGKNEELVRIRGGKPAPADTVVTIRQLVLYMDEEVAAAEHWAETDGFDFRHVKEFDKWLLKSPDHLRQVLPEEKGVVAIKPRRNQKHYDDNPFINAELNRQNKCLYILIRNGAILYRVYTNLWLEDVFFPRRDQFEKFFEREETDWTDPNYRRVRKPMRPGSEEYMEAMKAAQADQRRYYTVLLLLQGIIDRTKILQPMAQDRVNVCDLHESAKYFRFLADAEDLLPSGRPDFDTWLYETNAKLDVGCRVVGHFDSYYVQDNYRVTVRPARAKKPKSGVLYTIDAREDEHFVFHYSREGETTYHGWGDWEGRPAKLRAACLIDADDPYFVNFDAVTVPDIEYYMNSRLNRHAYARMLPLLQQVVEAKKKEAAEERPFRKLLVGEIMKAHGVSLEAAEARIDELIDWWKFKTKIHRALTSEDAKALRMIVKEFGSRAGLAATDAAENAAVVAALRAAQPDLLAVFRKPDGDFVAYRHANDEAAFVHELLWRRGAVAEVKEWVVVDKRHERWLLLWSHERWATWAVGASANDHLTDAEYAQAVEFALTQFDEFLTDKDPKWGLPLGVTFDEGNFHLYFADAHGIFPPDDRLLSGGIKGPAICSVTIKWKKTAAGTEFKVPNWPRSSETIVPRDYDSPPWKHGKVLRVWDENAALVEAEHDRHEGLKARRSKLAEPGWRASKLVGERLKECWYEEQHVVFLEEYMDDDAGTLWEMHKESLREPYRVHSDWISGAVDHLVERGESVWGISVGETVARAVELGYEFDAENQKDYEKTKDVVIEAEADGE